MELNNEQKKFVQSNESKILLLSAAGSGKTRCIVERVKYLISNGEKPEKIVVLTFTNLATEELRQRLDGYPVLIFTIHSYCNYLLRCGGHDTSNLLNEDNFDELFNEINKYPECAQEVNHLLLDEGHDTDENQFTFLFDIVKPKNWVVCADFKQTIYEWRGAYPEYIIKLSKNPEVSVYELSTNFRCRSRILNYAKRIIGKLGYDYEDTSKAANLGGEIYEIEYDLNYIINFFKRVKNYKDWFILTRNNDEIKELGARFDKYKIPYVTFKQGDINLATLNEELEKNQIVLITIHSSKGLERPNVMVIGATWWGTENYRVNYVAATRAKDMLVWVKPKKKKKTYTMNWE